MKQHKLIASLYQHFNQSFRLNTTESKPRKFSLLLFIAILLISIAGIHIMKANSLKAAQLQEGIAHEIIRFHVIANSDSPQDQALKLKVKEALVEEMSIYLSKAEDIYEAREIISSKLANLQTLAQDLIDNYGYSYPVTVSLESCYFPIKVYGDYTFPAGTYEALRVKIGEAEGQNWWCVMFPPLCFVDETYSIIDEKTDQQLKFLLTEEEYDTLRSKKVPVKVKFKLWDYIKKLFC